VWREPESGVLPVLEELGIGFVPYSPLNRGFLGGALNEHTRFDSGNDNRNTLPKYDEASAPNRTQAWARAVASSPLRSSFST
jgi:aryl-alcohol dehydrogenase-like predicted oxidoreductase